MKKQLLVIGLLAATALPAAAGDFYALGNVAQTSFADGSEKSGLGIGLGYDWNKYVALELDYRALGSFKDSFFDSDVGNVSAKYDFSATQFSILGKLPLTPKFNLFGRVGSSTITLEGHFSYSGGKDSASSDSSKTLVGFGGDYKANDKFKVRLEYLKWQDTEIHAVSLGGTYTF